MTNFLGGAVRASKPNPPATQLRVQTSIQGSVIPIGWGVNRIAPNLLYYNDVVGTPVQSSSAGGKGTGGGSSSKAGGGSGQYSYTATVIMGLAEGPVNASTSLYVWRNKELQTTAALGLTLFNGSYSQNAWSYVSTAHPGDARPYRGIAYLAGAGYALGSSPELPNISVEVQFPLAAYPDANPAGIVVDFLTNQYYGLGFPSNRIGDGGNLATFSAYCAAVSMFMSPVLTQQRPANSFLQDVLYGAVAEAVWSGGKLKIVPYWDTPASGNGATYTPSLSPIYSLGEDDFIIGGSAGNAHQAPVIVTRKAIQDRYNSVKIQFNDRANNYNPTITEAKDDAEIQAYSLRARDTKTLDLFCYQPSAALAAYLQLGREKVAASYQFTIGARYVLLEPMDLVSISDANLGLNQQLVRIKEITENEDFTLTIMAEDALVGHASAPQYGSQANAGFIPNYNADPGLTNTPYFFEPTEHLAGGLEVMMAVSPQNLTLWGGCNVYVSYDGSNYQYVGQQLGPARMGVLTAPLPSVTAATTPPTIDLTSTLSVDLTSSGAQLTSGTFDDLKAFASLCYVAGEFLAFQTATPTGANKYNLTTLNRGGYGTTPVSASSGSTFVRIDAGVFRIPFTQDRIGQTLYVKLVSFNKFGGGPQSLATVSAYTYVLQGTALNGPLPNVQNFRYAYQSNVGYLAWDEVTDFRQPVYEIRKGSSWSAGAIIGRFAHPPVPTFGDDIYWIKAYAQPVAGLAVYSTTETELILTGSILPLNLAKSWNEFSPLPPSGLYGGSAFFNGTFIQNSGTGDILSTTDVLSIPDIFDYGNIGPGTYEIPFGHEIDIGRVAACMIGINWTFAGALATNNFFAYNPLFAVVDFFGAVANQLVNVYPEIALSQDGVSFAAWQRYNAGTYNFRKAKARMQIQSVDPTVYAYLTSFTFTVWAPTRVDHFVGVTIDPAVPRSATFTFVPDGTATPTPFNGGPNNSSVPNVLVTIMGAQPGDIAQVNGLTTSGCTVQIVNGGVAVKRTCNVFVEGF